MPRIVRNFWIEGETDSGTRFGTGPKGKQDGFSAIVYQRADGDVSTALRLRGYASADGTLRLEIEPACGAGLETIRTEDGAGCIIVRSQR